jgi:hypothetical protein
LEHIVDRVVAEADTNEDGFISFEEFQVKILMNLRFGRKVIRPIFTPAANPMTSEVITRYDASYV